MYENELAEVVGVPDPSGGPRIAGPIIEEQGRFRVRMHHGYGHGLRPGEDRDLNCLSCRREDEQRLKARHTAAVIEARWATEGDPWDRTSGIHGNPGTHEV